MIGFILALFGFTVVAFPKQAEATFTSATASVRELFGPPVPPQQNDLLTLARTIWGEARGEGAKGMQAVANVIMNRYKLAKNSASYASRWGSTIAGVCTKNKQFSVWNATDPNRAKMLAVTADDANFQLALSIASQAINGTLADITKGATSYYTGAKPYWAVNVAPIGTIGSHTFFKDV